MDLMEGDLSKFSWGKTISIHKESYQSYKAYYCLVKQAKIYTRGTIIKFWSAYKNSEESWQKWFYEKDDFKKYLRQNKKRNLHVPLYADNEYALIVSRYKWIKQKYKCFIDYGTIIMMLTGPKVGHIFKIYIACPFQLITEFPFSSKYLQLINQLPQHTKMQEIIEHINDQKINLYSSQARDIFVEKMVEAFGDRL
jgi:hypothetical protein